MNTFAAKCKCQHCSQNIEFEAFRAGETIACPGCGMDTTLFVPNREMKISAAPENSPEKKNIAIICLVIVLVSVLAFIAAMADKEDVEINPMLVLLFGLVGGILYFVPALIGSKKRQFAAIFALNLLLGWSLVGWAGALIWALVKEKSE